MSGTVTIAVIGGGAPIAEVRAALGAARRVIGSAALLRAVHGLVDPGALTDVLPDAAYDDMAAGDGRHRWDLPPDPQVVVVLAPPGAPARAVARSLRDSGVHVRSLDEARSARAGDQPHSTGPPRTASPPLAVVGLPALGTDAVAQLGGVALTVLAGAGLAVGGARQLAAVDGLLDPAARRVELTGDLTPGLAALAARTGPAVVVASGDPGFFGILRAVREHLGADAPAPTVLPAVSAVAAVAAAAGVPWDDAVVVSAHGRDPRRARNAVRRFPVVAVLTAPDVRPADLAAGCPPRRWTVASRLGAPDATVVAGTEQPADLPDPAVVLAVDPAAPVAAKGVLAPARRTPTAWALADDAFVHRAGMVTKREVRALALAWLGPGVGDLVWDVGAGTGSIAVECSRLGAAAVAVERDADQCARIRRNAARHGAPVEVVHGTAPAALAALPDPDAVFVGGGGRGLTAVLDAVTARGPRVVVVALATLERVGPARDALEAAGHTVEGTLLSAARLAPLGQGTRLAATNPVVLLCGTTAAAP